MKKTSLLTLALALSLGITQAMASTATADAKHPKRSYLLREFVNVIGPMRDVEIEYRDIDADGLDEVIMTHRAASGLDAFVVFTCNDPNYVHTLCADSSFPTGSYAFPAKGFVSYTVTDGRHVNGDFAFDTTETKLISKAVNSTPVYTLNVTRQLLDGVDPASVNADNYLISFDTTCTLTVEGHTSAITIPEAMNYVPEAALADFFAPELEAEMAERAESIFVSISTGLVDHSAIYSEATELYCSAALKDLFKRGEAARPTNKHRDYIDYDYWFMTQEELHPSVTVDRARLADARHGEVALTLIDGGEPYNDLTLKMVKEDGEWKIDDFVTDNGAATISIATVLKDYLRK